MCATTLYYWVTPLEQGAPERRGAQFRNGLLLGHYPTQKWPRAKRRYMTKMKLTQNYSTKLSCFYYDTVSRMSSRVVHWGLVFQIREVKYLYLFEILIGSQRWSLHCIQSLVGLLLGKVSVTCNRKPKRVDIMKC